MVRSVEDLEADRQDRLARMHPDSHEAINADFDRLVRFAKADEAQAARMMEEDD